MRVWCRVFLSKPSRDEEARSFARQKFRSRTRGNEAAGANERVCGECPTQIYIPDISILALHRKIIVDIYQQETLYFFQYIFRLDPMLDRDGGIERIFKPSEPSSEGFFI